MGRTGALSESLSDAAQVSVLTASPAKICTPRLATRRFGERPGERGLVFNYGTFVGRGFTSGLCAVGWTSIGGAALWSIPEPVSRQGRALHEQVPASEDVRAIVDYLEWNALLENEVRLRFFQGQLCHQGGGRAREALAIVLTPSVSHRQHLPRSPRPFTAGHPWSAFGMELILGAVASTAMPACGHAFLPDVLSHQLSLMTLDGQPLAFPVEVVFPNEGPWHAGLPEGDAGRNAPVLFMWGWALWMALNVMLTQRKTRWRVLGRRLSVAVTAVTAAAMALLFVLMQLITDHNDTWWNADLVWALGGWGVLWVFLKRARGARPEDLGMARKVAAGWTVLALGSVLVLPAMRSGLTWGEATVWASVGACLAVVCAVWTSLKQA